MARQRILAESPKKSVPIFESVQSVEDEKNRYAPQVSGLVHRKLSDPRQLTPQDVLALQRTVGNQAVQRLLYPKTTRQTEQSIPAPSATLAATNDTLPLHEQFSNSREGEVQRSTPQISGGVPGKKLHTGLPAMVQRKAYIGQDYKAVNPTSVNDEQAKKLAEDKQVRRFKDNNEYLQFAKGKPIRAGLMSNGQWVRVDEFVVLGEYHNNQETPKIINALGTNRFRYEGWTHHSATRMKNDAAFKSYKEKGDKDMGTKYAIDDKNILGRTHEAEHALPKYARLMPDVIEVVRRQIKEADTNPELAPGKAQGRGYSRFGAYFRILLESLLYTRSYKGKWFPHPLKAFAKENSAALDEAITVLQANPDDQVPDMRALSIVSKLRALKDIYVSQAMKKLGLTEDSLSDFNDELGSLGPGKRPYETKEAEENDKLRDYSMLNTIKKSKKSGDYLFVIGEVHRMKLAPLLEQNGIESMQDKSFIHKEMMRNELLRAQEEGEEKPPAQAISKPQEAKSATKWYTKAAKYFSKSK
jgi:hypothetical protein